MTICTCLKTLFFSCIIWGIVVLKSNPRLALLKFLPFFVLRSRTASDWCRFWDSEPMSLLFFLGQSCHQQETHCAGKASTCCWFFVWNAGSAPFPFLLPKLLFSLVSVRHPAADKQRGSQGSWTGWLLRILVPCPYRFAATCSSSAIYWPDAMHTSPQESEVGTK